ncbi:hypothetical protein H310_10184 [Aphanomyces invadans]|uniref:FYVE-type domain-containing protein n=1 Tax=Aphanomyces invadans TaxID=157072 RepID=A0A024TQM4_9STRA|nr:hypothetical protein H310_10184 [Aphanomyces invadans]ETV96425.1 hypothetical protein H310_10184 [Aphanomyces invadans]|eukprot:XP_008874688.1 hypothetical protein H310_10184 [Aphanomyces invadans]
MFSLPLNPGHFQSPPLSTHEIDLYKAMAKQSVDNVIKKSTLVGGPVKWSLKSREGDLRLYKADNFRSTHERDILCGVMEVIGTLDEVMRLYRCETTADTKEYVRRFGRAYVDAVHLYTVMPRQPDRPNDSIHIKWGLVKGPVDGLIARRDVCILESNMELRLHGRRAWVRAFTSVQLQCVPDMRDALNAIRALQFDMGHVFVESDRPGYIVMTNLADMNPGGILTDWAAAQAIKTWCRQLMDIDGFLREDRLSATPFLRPDQLCPSDLRSRCHLCTKQFGLLRKKTQCVKCGEVLCRRCIKEWQVRWNGIPVIATCCYPCSLRNPASFKVVKGPPAPEQRERLLYELATPTWGADVSLVGSSPRSSTDNQPIDDDVVASWNIGNDASLHHYLLPSTLPLTMRARQSKNQTGQSTNSRTP